MALKVQQALKAQRDKTVPMALTVLTVQMAQTAQTVQTVLTALMAVQQLPWQKA
jgi:hypothetical protein